MRAEPDGALDWLVVSRTAVAGPGERYAEVLGFDPDDAVAGYGALIGPLLTPGIMSYRPLATQFGREGNDQRAVGVGFTGTVYWAR